MASWIDNINTVTSEGYTPGKWVRAEDQTGSRLSEYGGQRDGWVWQPGGSYQTVGMGDASEIQFVPNPNDITPKLEPWPGMPQNDNEYHEMVFNAGKYGLTDSQINDIGRAGIEGGTLSQNILDPKRRTEFDKWFKPIVAGTVAAGLGYITGGLAAPALGTVMGGVVGGATSGASGTLMNNPDASLADVGKGAAIGGAIGGTAAGASNALTSAGTSAPASTGTSAVSDAAANSYNPLSTSNIVDTGVYNTGSTLPTTAGTTLSSLGNVNASPVTSGSIPTDTSLANLNTSPTTSVNAVPPTTTPTGTWSDSTKYLVGTGVTGALGIGGAVIGANASENAATTAANATRDATTQSIDAQERMYQQGRTDFEPFRNLAPQSLATLQSSVYGTPQTYTDVNGQQQTANAKQYDLANFNPEATKAYDWQKARTLEDLGNYFNLVGRGRGSTVQSNATTRALGDLNANEYNTGYNRLFQEKQDYQNNLLNLVKTAQGAAGSTTALGSNAANQTTGALTTQGNNLANIATQQGNTQANLYAGIVPSLVNTAATGANIYDIYNKK